MIKIIRISLIGIGIGIGLTVIFTLLEFIYGNEVRLDQDFAKDAFYNVLFALVLTIINFFYFDYLNYNVVWKRGKRYRILIGGLGGIALTITGIFLIRVFIIVGLERKAFSDFIAGETANYYLVSLLIAVFCSIFFHAFYFYKELQKNKIKEQKVIAGTATAQFDALKNQLDPHFLFNSLNVLTSLIDENPDQAQKFTTSLSKVYRYVLEQKNKDLVPVDEELDFAKTYVSLLKMRFEDSIIFEIPEKASNPEAKLVPLSLQLLLENTVKHNTVNPAHPLRIRIYESDGHLVVENNFQPKQTLGKGSGVGLKNIQQRYQILSDRKVIIETTTTHFKVQLPMLTKALHVMKTQTSNDSYLRARKRVDELKEFYSSLISYVIVIPFLAFINYRVYWGFQWFWFPMIGWGIGLIFQAYKVYGPGFSWEEKKIRQYMEEESRNKKWN